MTRERVCASLVIAGIVTLTGPAATQQPRLERIEVAVTTTGGTTVAGLGSGDFDVLVDGKPVAIRELIAPPAPITMIALFDVTASMLTYADIGGEIERSLARSMRSEDRARIGGIASHLSLAPKFSSAGRELIDEGRKALDFREREKYGPSPIWDALKAAVGALESEPGRRGIIFVTDGRATGNTVSSLEAIQTALAAGVVVQVLSERRTMFLRQDKDSYAQVRAGLRLEDLTRLSGGMILPEDSKTTQLPEPGPSIARLVNDLREMYTIVIAAEGPAGSGHRVEVKVKRPGLAVRARPMYLSR